MLSKHEAQVEEGHPDSRSAIASPINLSLFSCEGKLLYALW